MTERVERSQELLASAIRHAIKSVAKGDNPEAVGNYVVNEVLEWVDHYRSEVERLERELEGTREYAKEGWAWLDEALDALGVETVFGIKDAKERAEKAEAEAQHYREALESVCNVGDRAAVQVARATLAASPEPAEQERLRDALTDCLELAAVANDGDPWYAEEAGIDAEAVYAKARAALAEPAEPQGGEAEHPSS